MKKTILVAEDYDDSRNLMKYILEGYGYRTLEATNGQEAVDVAKKFHPDLILMDISMPVMDGFTATQLIRKSDGMSRLPIIAVTSLDKSYYRQAIEAGCDDLINKPVDSKALRPILNQYLGH
jgi:two-component system, cell cycle response regulator DivK